MNKTISINLGGQVFNIEEHAFHTLNDYLNKIKQNFVMDDAADEIMLDIEGRLAELFHERNNERKNVITDTDVNEVIAIMGQPEDYVTGDEDSSSHSAGNNESRRTTRNKSRRIFRDTDDFVLGGVCAGLSHYFGWDPIVIRILMVLLAFISAGTAILGYILFWALVPEAVTTAEKLQMRGEPVNIDSIGKMVNEEVKNATDKVNKFGKEMSSSVKKNSSSVVHGLGRAFAVCFGLVFLIMGIALLIGLIAFFGFSDYQFMGLGGNDLQTLNSVVFGNDGSLFYFVIGVVLVVLMPALGLLYTAIKLITDTKKGIKGFGIITLSLFILGVGLCAYSALHTSKQFVYKVSDTNEYVLQEMHSDTLFIDAALNKTLSEVKIFDRDFSGLLQKENGMNFYEGLVEMKIRKSKNENFSVEVEKQSRGKNSEGARTLVEHIDYQYAFRNDSLFLPSGFTTPENDSYRMQKVKVTVYVPVGAEIILGENAKAITWHRNPKSGRLLKMYDHGLSESGADDDSSYESHDYDDLTDI